LFASDRLADLSASNGGDRLGAVISEHRDIVLAGAQGPDPFFYYGKGPFRRRADQQAVSDFGTVLHAMDPSEVFPVLAERAVEERGGRRNIAFAYIYGLITHYVLDRNYHPYVFYRTGFDSSGGLSGPFSADHTRFETLLGAAYLDTRRVRALESGVRPSAVPRYRETAPRRAMRVDPDKLGVAGDLWAAAFPSRVRPMTYPDAWFDMRKALSFLWDPFHLKRALYAVFGGSATKSRALIPPRRPARSDTIDYLNECAESWLHPVSGDESKATVNELCADASRDADLAREILSAAYEGRDVGSLWQPLLAGVNHEGFKTGESPRYFQSVYGRAQPNR